MIQEDGIDLSILKQRWPSAIVARCKVAEFTGGLVSSGTMANADCEGTGPEGALRIGKKIAYPVDSLIAWIEQRSSKQGRMPRKSEPAAGCRQRRVKQQTT